MATTTPPPLTVTEPPPTPLYGAKQDPCAADHARKAKKQRVARQAQARTPSPSTRVRSSDSASPGLRRSARLRSSVHSPPSSPLSPSRPQRPRPRPAGAKGSEANEKKGKLPTSEDHLSAPSFSASSMLPTPTKTPRKKDIKKSPSVTRVLFPNGPQPVEEAMPKPHKRGGRTKAFSLESFKSTDGAATEIEIFTDTRDKIPDIDVSADNPFYTLEDSSPKSKRKVNHSKPVGRDEEKLKEVIESDKGMVYVFRGQRRYKQFRETDDDIPEEGGEAAANGLSLEAYPEIRPFTRSSVKPRVLFPRAEAAPAGTTTDEEEAPTDIDEAEATTPTKPDPPISAAGPMTPPTTGARNKKRVVSYELGSANDDEIAEDSLFTVKKARRRDGKAGATPFASWKRTKPSSGIESSATMAKGKKRAADEDLREDVGKRAKGETEISS